MPKLNQILAIEKGIKNNQNSVINEAYKTIQKTAQFAGISRTYQPLADDGEKFPAESTLVQARGDQLLKTVTNAWSKLFDITTTKDVANSHAKSDIVVDGVTILKDVPVTTLLFLEKQLVDLHTFIGKLPTLDPSEEWSRNDAQNAWASKPTQTTKSKKIPKPFVKAEATKEHPAQVEVVHEDVVQGYWTAIKYSGAMPATRVQQLLERVEALQVAVKFARENANTVEAPPVAAGEQVFSYLLRS